MKLANEEIKRYQQQALYYCDMFIADKDRMIKQYEIDCKTEKVDVVGRILIPPLTDIYYSVKKNKLSREDAIQQQKSLFEIMDVEE